MPRYNTREYIRAWARAAFGLIVAIAIGMTFDSWFLGILTFTFLFFIPLPHTEDESGLNSVIFGILMTVVLFMAFGGGLNLDLGVSFSKSILPVITFLAFVILIIMKGALNNRRVALRIAGVSRAGARDLMQRSNVWAYLAGAAFIITILMFWVVGGGPWTWPASAVIFLGVWLIGFITGVTGSVSRRQGIGVAIILVSFFIFTMGVGTQEVGSAAFGQWWPTVYQTGSQIFGPLGDAWGQLTSGLGTGISLITNPMGFAQQVMNGSYGRDPTTGLTGAFGVEIEQFTSTPIFVEQPYSVSMMIKNKGAFEAENVWVAIVPEEDAPDVRESVEKKTVSAESAEIDDMNVKMELTLPTKGITMKDLGFETTEEQYCGNGGNEFVCLQNAVPEGEKMQKLDLRQLFFQSNGIDCATVEEYDITERFVPLKGYIQYDYRVDSQLPVEFMSNTEWDRRIRENQLVTQTKKASTVTNAPVKLSIDTMEQPIRGGNRFYVGFLLASAKGEESEVDNVTIQIEKPDGIKFYEKDVTKACTTGGEYIGDGEGHIWEFSEKPYLILCQFDELALEEPTKTFLFKANASYTFSESKNLVTKMEFGGVDCSLVEEENDENLPPI